MAATSDDTDWRRIAGLYAILADRYPSPIVELNRAVAVAQLHGAHAGLELVDAVAESGTIDGYHLLHAVRADLLVRAGRSVEARTEFLRAAELTENVAERLLLVERADACASSMGRNGRGAARVASSRACERMRTDREAVTDEREPRA